jgi:hypothetical protein
VARRRPPMLRAMSPLWDRAWRTFYWVVTRLGPVARPWVERFGLGNVVELVVPGRHTGRERAVLLGLLRVDGGWYLGHPNGAANWTRNLDAAGGATLIVPRQPPARAITAALLPIGEERRRVIASTWHQHLYPGRVLYWLARRHVVAVGRYYRIELEPPPAGNRPGRPGPPSS